MKQDIYNFVVECEVCQCNKGETVKSPGTIQSLLIPPAICKDISMDFITSLPKSGNKSIIMVVVDHLSKYSHFYALQNQFMLHIQITQQDKCRIGLSLVASVATPVHC
jgi:hypothetical protein